MEKWGKVDYNTESLYMGTQVKVEKGYYYRLRGYHSCTKMVLLKMAEVQLMVSILDN